MESRSIEPQAARLTHNSFSRNVGAAVVGAPSVIAVVTAGAPRLASHAVSAHTPTKPTKRADHKRPCPCEEMRGSIRKGKLRSASNEAKFDSANKGYVCEPPSVRACHDCTSGLVALSRTNGRPIEAVVTMRTCAAG